MSRPTPGPSVSVNTDALARSVGIRAPFSSTVAKSKATVFKAGLGFDMSRRIEGTAIAEAAATMATADAPSARRRVSQCGACAAPSACASASRAGGASEWTAVDRLGATVRATVFARASSGATSAFASPSRSVSSLTSECHRMWLSSNPFRNTKSFRSSGRRSCAGIDAPCTSSGVTGILRLSAVAISCRTKSAGSSSRRRPPGSFMSSQLVPISASTASQDSNFSWRAARKSRPSAMLSTSMNTEFLPT